MMTRWTALTVAAALAGAVVAWLGLSAVEAPGAATPSPSAAKPATATAAAEHALPVAPAMQHGDLNPASTGSLARSTPASGSTDSASYVAGNAAGTAATSSATASPAAASAASTATPEQRAAAQALVLASFHAAPGPTTVQPAPVELRRNRRLPAPAVPDPSDAMPAADTGLRGFPGAVALAGQSFRSGNTVSTASQAFASFQDVRNHFAAQLQPSADGMRQLQVLADTEQVFDARLVDLRQKTVQRAQVAAGEASVVVQLSRVDVR